MTNVAVLLQTCDRVEYTARTLESFAAHNAGAPFLLLHGDDASEDRDGMRSLAGRHGFETVVQSETRQGVLVTQAGLVRAAARRGASWVFMLENDILTLRAFPWALFHFIQKQPAIYCLRLFGRFKDAAKTVACKTTHSWQQNAPVDWRPLRGAPEMSQVARIHWTPLSSVTRTSDLLSLHRGYRPNALTARVKKNVMGHFGDEQTPGRIV